MVVKIWRVFYNINQLSDRSVRQVALFLVKRTGVIERSSLESTKPKSA